MSEQKGERLGTCSKCGGLHYGSVGCSYEDTVCRICHKTLLQHEGFCFCEGGKAEHNPQVKLCTCESCVKSRTNWCEQPSPSPAPERCAVCGWPLAKTRNKGCRPGDCSLRPLPERAYDPVRANEEYSGRRAWPPPVEGAQPQAEAQKYTYSNDPDSDYDTVNDPATLSVAEQFSLANRQRCEAPDGFNHKLDSWSTSDWFTAILGELGEAANVAKKLNRVRDGIRGNKEQTEQLKTKLRQELGDTFVYLDLLTQSLGFNIFDAAIEVFNAKSQELGYQVRFQSHGESEQVAQLTKERDALQREIKAGFDAIFEYWKERAERAESALARARTEALAEAADDSQHIAEPILRTLALKKPEGQ